ncbi:hypothetical protein JW978_03480, partial [Candidatus Dojkabacteria bacterium]|nr:hypothetical protein [Candidatus Dojkabacteria bacterium]
MANKIIYKKPLIFFFVVGMFYSLLLTVLLYSTEPSFAAACPVLDGGVGDGDSTVNGVITISANATWSADGTNLGSFDCSGTEVHVTNNAVLSLASYQDGDSDYTDDYGVTIIADDITVDSGASISANSLGYPDDKGIGYAGTLGSGYGGLGYGTTDTSKAYGSVYEPDDLGSGGADSYGGGAMKFIVSDTLI